MLYLQHISLQSTQHMRAEEFVQFFDLIFFGNVGEFVLEGGQVVEFGAV